MKKKSPNLPKNPKNHFQLGNKSRLSFQVKKDGFMNSTINLVLGDIAEQTADALVNAANNHLWMGGGVAGALKSKGGEIIEQEAMAKCPVRAGEAVVTTAGSLKAKYVIHAVVMGQDLQTDENKIRMATQASLKRAEELEIESIAFPALGTGVGGFSKEKCARIMINEIIYHLNNNNSLIKRIDIILFDQTFFIAFERELTAILNNPNN